MNEGDHGLGPTWWCSATGGSPSQVLFVFYTSLVTILRTSYRPEPSDLFPPCYSEAAVFTLPFRYGSEVTDSIPAAIKGGGVRVSPEPTRLCCKQSKLPAPISY